MSSAAEVHPYPDIYYDHEITTAMTTTVCSNSARFTESNMYQPYFSQLRLPVPGVQAYI